MSRQTEAHPTIAGTVIGIATVLTIALVAHHPVAAGQDHSEILNDIVRQASMDRLVHGGLIAIVGALLFGFSLFASCLDASRPLIRLGLIAYTAGCAGLVGAAVIDGFITPDIATRFAAAPADDLRVAYGFLIFGGSAIQYLTKLSFVLLSTGIASWSLALIGAGGPRRWAGLFGLIAGGVPTLLILTTGTVMTPYSLIAILALQGVWNLAISALLIRTPGRLSPADA
jgi:hypothetical protein